MLRILLIILHPQPLQKGILHLHTFFAPFIMPTYIPDFIHFWICYGINNLRKFPSNCKESDQIISKDLYQGQSKVIVNMLSVEIVRIGLSFFVSPCHVHNSKIASIHISNETILSK